MKIGITYLYTIMSYGYPPAIGDDFKALADIEKMGFHYLEMEALGPKHAEAVWKHREEFKSRLDAHGIHVHNFCAVDPDLVSLDSSLRKTAVERFKRSSELGAYLGTETIHLASYAPPVEYLSGRPYELGEDYAIPEKITMRIPDGFCWERVWEALVDSCRQTAEIAKGLERTIIMEPRVGEVICSTDSMIRLINDVNMANFKANFDTGHFGAQRENVPLALMKLEGKFANIHISDNNPINSDHLPVGDGIIDWMEFFRILKHMGYDGYLGLDLTGDIDTLKDGMKRSIDYIKAVAKQLDINVTV